MSSQELIALNAEKETTLDEEILLVLDKQAWSRQEEQHECNKKIREIMRKLYPIMFRSDLYDKLSPVSGIPAEDESRARSKFLKVLEILGKKTNGGLNALDFEKINKMHERLADLSADESDGWIFQQSETNVDIDFWSKMPAWTADQAIIITIGKDPRYIEGAYLNKWTQSVAGVLDSKDEEFIKHYVKIRDLLLCARDSGVLVFPVPSLVFIKWTKQFDIEFPQDLAERVLSYHKEHDFKALHQSSISECKSLSEQREALKLKNNKLHQEKSDLQRSYNTAAKMLTGVANNKFENDRSKITKIQSTLDLEGVSADRKTISEHLEKGKELIKKDSEKANLG